FDPRFVACPVEHLHQALLARIERAARLSAQGDTRLASGPGESLETSAIRHATERDGHEVRGAVVMAWRERDLERAIGPAIELGRASRAGARPPVSPPVLRGQEARRHEPVEMEGRQLAADPEP